MNIMANPSLAACTVHNMGESPLLRLPGEIRMMIWRACLGDRTVHVDRGGGHEEGKELETKWIHVVCQAEMPLNEAYQASTVQRDESHRACEDVFLTSVSENAYRPSAERLPVPLLRVCTQIHEECAKILYETNTYEFSVPSTFFKFLKMLRAHHTQYLWKISFWISWMVDDWSIMMHSYLDTTEGILEKRNLGWIWRLKFPVLKTAQIIAVDLQIADDDWPGRYDDRDEWLSVAQKKKVREDIESRLLTNRS